MAKYISESGDLAYRRVSLRSDRIPDYTNFSMVGEVVNYGEEIVLEILHDDYSTSRHFSKERTKVAWSARGSNEIVFTVCQTGHLWIRQSFGGDLLYKIPEGLPNDGRNACFLVPGGANQVHLWGDEYFETAYELTP